MTLWNVGSITSHVGAIIGWSNIPTTISGIVMNNMCEQEINFCEQYKSVTIDSSAIPEKYQPVVIDLLHSKVLLVIQANLGASDVSLGDLSISAGQGGYSELAKQLREDALLRLKELQRSVRFKRSIGGV